MADPAYYQVHEFTTEFDGQAIRVVTKRGLADWDCVSPASSLLASHVRGAADSRMLLVNSGHGFLGVVLAKRVPSGTVCILDTDYIARRMSERTLAANDVDNARIWHGITVLPEDCEGFQVAVLQLPRGRKLARRLLVEAYGALKPEGRLYLAGANGEGVRSVIKDAEDLFGNASVLAYKKGNRVAMAVKHAHRSLPEWAAEPGIAPGTRFEFELEVRTSRFRLRSTPGVFSYDRLDEGSGLLLSMLKTPQGSRVLDVGCGYGVIGLAAAQWGAGNVDMVDVNLLAVESARENAVRNAVGNARAIPSDILSSVRGQEYDLVVSNPPFHVGKAVDYDVAHAFIQDSQHVLRPGGKLLIVANRFIRYDQLLRKEFRKVECVVETGQYWVLSATK